MYYEYRIVKIDKKFKTKPKAEAWARKNLV